MSRKIARITQEKKLLLANEVVESNAKTSLNSDGRLEVDEIIEYPVELEGGRNLIRNSDFSFGGDMWDGNFNITEEGALLESVAGRADYIQNTTLIPEGEYVVQIRYRVVEGQAPYLHVADGTDMTSPKGLYVFTIGDNEWQTVTIPIIVNSASRFYAIRYAAGSPVDHLEGKVLIQWIKIEKGNKATDWTPAPEDIDQAINTVDTKIDNKVSEINLSLDGITSRVSDTESAISTIDGEVSSLQSRMQTAEQKITPNAIVQTVRESTAYQGDLAAKGDKSVLDNAVSTISQHATLISQRVEKNNIISEINQSAETIKIQASRIDLVGQVTAEMLNVDDLSAITANLGTVTAGEIDGAGFTSRRMEPNGEIWIRIDSAKLVAHVDPSVVGAASSYAGELSYTPTYDSGGVGHVGVDWRIYSALGDINLQVYRGNINFDIWGGSSYGVLINGHPAVYFTESEVW